MDAGGGNEADIAVWRQSCLACGLERSLGFRCSDPVVDLCGRSLLRILNFFFFFSILGWALVSDHAKRVFYLKDRAPSQCFFFSSFLFSS